MQVMTTPRIVDLEISSQCNLRCRYCYYLNNHGVKYHDLPTADWVKLFRELRDAKVMEVCLAGGEPLLRRDLFELIDSITENRMRFVIVTNGLLLLRETALRLSKNGRCNYVQVSLDGSEPESHEALRGKESFFAALNAIRLLQEVGVPVAVRVTVHPRNIHDLPNLAKLLLEELALPHFSTNSVTSLGSNKKFEDDVFLRPVDRLRAMKTMAVLDARYPGRILATAGPLADWRMFREMRKTVKGRGCLPGRGRLIGCGCFFHRLAVRADGAYIPCVALPQFVLGHIGQDSLRQVWLSSPSLNSLRERINIRLATFAQCRDCDYIDACTGSCAGNAYSALGDVNQPSPEGCLRQFEQGLASEGVLRW